MRLFFLFPFKISFVIPYENCLICMQYIGDVSWPCLWYLLDWGITEAVSKEKISGLHWWRCCLKTHQLVWLLNSYKPFFSDVDTLHLKKPFITGFSSLWKIYIANDSGIFLYINIIRKYMRSGISIWLDVPLEALAKRITAVGTNSRPLLHEGTEDDYLRVCILPIMIHSESDRIPCSHKL